MMISRLMARFVRHKFIQKNKKRIFPFFHAVQDLKYKKLMERNITLKNRYEGKRCFIFGAGRSSDEVDLLRFRNEYTFACNSFLLHEDFDSLSVSFYAVVDTIYGLMNKTEPGTDVNVYYPRMSTSESVKNTIFFCDVSLNNYIKKNGYLKEREVYYTARSKVLEKKIDAIDLEKRNDAVVSAGFFMLAASIYMGFDELYLLGMGYTYYPRQLPYFSALEKLLPSSAELSCQAMDTRYHDLKKIAEENGVKIFNVVPDGFESPVFAKITLDEAYQRIGE